MGHVASIVEQKQGVAGHVISTGSVLNTDAQLPAFFHSVREPSL